MERHIISVPQVLERRVVHDVAAALVLHVHAALLVRVVVVVVLDVAERHELRFCNPIFSTHYVLYSLLRCS